MMIEPFYFGSQSHRLFGMYHPPLGSRVRDVGAVLCYPMGQEYIRAHRGFVYLAGRLSLEGFHVLRFDYYGCGDSAGEGSEVTVSGSVADVSLAADELVRAGMTRLALIGLRLGAALAMLCARQRDDVEAVILWEPVIRGADYVAELDDAHRAWLSGAFAGLRRGGNAPQSQEVMGFPMPDSLRKELADCDLTTLTRPPARHVHVLSHTEERQYAELATSMTPRRGHAGYAQVSYPHTWGRGKTVGDKGLVPVRALEHIRTQLLEVFA
jgi:pimeloyl-ACP methyl ester carboxylesterase